MENTVDLLKEKMGVLKRNLDGVGREALETKYRVAYKRLLEEIDALSKEVMHNKIMYLDLASVPEEALPKFTSMLEGKKEEITMHLRNGDFEEYIKLMDALALEYGSLWCEHVYKGHVPGESYIYNPFTMEKIGELKQGSEITMDETAVVA